MKWNKMRICVNCDNREKWANSREQPQYNSRVISYILIKLTLDTKINSKWEW